MSSPSTESAAFRSALDVVRSVEPGVADAIAAELASQRASLKLIASENYASPAVLLAMGNWLSDKYAEGTIGRRFYAGCAQVDTIETIGAGHARELFGAPHAYLQPHSGIDANLVAYWAILARRIESPALERAGARHVNDLSEEDWSRLRHELGNQRMLGMSLDAGGHLTHGFRPNISGKMFDQRSYGTDPDTGLIDYAVVRETAREFRPLILVAGYSAYPRRINFAAMREIADEVGATFMVDMAHFAGLVAGKVLTGDFDPVPHAHIVTTTTHKSLRGPRGGMVLCQPELAEAVDRGCPLVLGGPLPNVMAAKAVALAEARQPSFQRVRPAHRGERPGPVGWPDPPGDPAGHRRHGQPPGAHRRRRLRADRAAGRAGPAGRGHRDQPQRDPARPERRLVHLRDPDRHPGADHPGAGHRGDGRDRRADPRGAEPDPAGNHLRRRAVQGHLRGGPRAGRPGGQAGRRAARPVPALPLGRSRLSLAGRGPAGQDANSPSIWRARSGRGALQAGQRGPWPGMFSQ